MRVTHVTVERLIPTESYANVRYALTAELAEGENLDAAVSALAECIRAFARAEIAYRYPAEEHRRYARWLIEDRDPDD